MTKPGIDLKTSGFAIERTTAGPTAQCYSDWSKFVILFQIQFLKFQLRKMNFIT